MLLALILAQVLQPADPRGPIFTNPATLNHYAFFEAFPASGAGTFGACSTTAPTGAKGEALTFSRASVAECYSNDGQTLTQLSSNQVRVSSGNINETQMGVWNEWASQNDITYARDLSHASWVKTNMTCTKTATGMRGDANSASRCTATGANGTVCASLVLAAATRNTSGHIKRVTGTGAVTLSRDNFATSTANISSRLSSTLWRRAVPSETPGCAGGNCIVDAALTGSVLNPTICLKLATSGDAVDIDFVQDEAGDKATSPILTAGAAAPRAVESGYFTVASTTIRSLGAEVQWRPGVPTFTTAAWAWKDANNALISYVQASGADVGHACNNFASGASNMANNTVLAPNSWGAFWPSACDFDGATGLNNLKGWYASTSVAVAPPTGVTRIYFGAAASLSGYEIGGVVRSMCADPTYGVCSGRQAVDSTQSPIAALGDSVIRGDAAAPSRPPVVLGTTTLRPVANLGIGGATAAQILTSWRTKVRGKGYRTLVLLAGVNSAATGVSAAATWADLQSILDEARADGLKVVPVTITPWKTSSGWAAGYQTVTETVNASVLAYCTTYSLTCVDAYASMGGGGGDPAVLAVAYDSGDHLHLNAAGGSALAALIAAANP